MSDISNFFVANAQAMQQLAAALQSVATVIALALGGVWTFRLFVRNRLDKPCAIITHNATVKDLSNRGLLIHASVQIQNQSAVMITITSGEVQLIPILPLSDGVTGLLDQYMNPKRSPGMEQIAWPKRLTIPLEWSKDPREIEPHESDTFHFDFVIDEPLSTFKIYSFFVNVSKGSRDIGWSTTTIHDVN